MILQLLLIMSFAGSGLQVFGISPGDENTICLRDPRFATFNYPASQRFLLDSYNYHDLLIQNNPSSLWKEFNADNSGDGWVQGQESICRRSVRVCDYQDNPEQRNWLFTQYISYQSSNEVYINITFNFTECRIEPLCKKLFMNVYFYSTNHYESQARTNPDNYEPIGQIYPNANSNQVLSFVRPVNHNGFYLGIEDVGSCATVIRVQVFYKICPAKVVGLVTYPSLALPPVNYMNPVVGTALCASNAVSTSPFHYRAFENGTCEYNSNCECRIGYQENIVPTLGSTLAVSVCEACPAGTYKSIADVTCQICPENTNTSFIAATQCSCISGYFRAKNENSSVACSSPPGGCYDIQVVSTTDSTINVMWRKPNFTGRADYYYNVYYSNPNSAGAFILHNKCPYVDVGGLVEYSVTTLLPQTNYAVRVTVHNGVSDQDLENIHLRTCEVTASTTDGSLEAPTNVKAFCKVITWEPPVSSDSSIVGYDVRFIAQSSMAVTVVSKSASAIYHIVQEGSKPLAEQNVMVQVRAKSHRALGPWSDAISIGCEATCKDSEIEYEGQPNRVTGVEVVNNVLVWNAPASPGDTLQYQVRYRRVDDEDGRIITIEQPLHAYQFETLDPGNEYTVEVRSLNTFGAGNWSDPYLFSYQSFQSQSLTIIKEPKSGTVAFGGNIEFSCSAFGGTKPLTFIWGTTAAITTVGLPEPFVTSDVDGSITSSIMLNNINQEYSGEYLCIVMDSRGSRIISLPANLTVIGTPDSVEVKFGNSMYNSSEDSGYISIDIVKAGNNLSPFSIQVVLDRSSSMTHEEEFSSVTEFNKVITFGVETQLLSLNVSIRNDEAALEQTEFLLFRLETVGSTNVMLGEPSVTRVQIYDDDSMTLGFNESVLVVEESSGDTTICLTKSRISAVALTVNIAVNGLSATPNDDFLLSSIPNVVIFEKSAKKKCFNVEILDNDVYEETESFQIVIESTNSSSTKISILPRVLIIQITNDDEALLDLQLMLNGQIYLNNSYISLEEINEDDRGLFCVTSYPNCCAGASRAGEFYYPNGNKVPILNRQDGFYRDRGDGYIRLNRLSGVLSPVGTFQCEIPNSAGVLLNISFTLTRNVVSFSSSSYFFLENAGEAKVCIERTEFSEASAGSLEVSISGSLQEETAQRIDQTLTFLPQESQKCFHFTVVDDSIALEDTEMLTFSIDHVSSNLYGIGDAGTTTIEIADDDVLTLRLGLLQNVTESGTMDVCITFSTQFARQFDIALSPVVADSLTLPLLAIKDNDYTIATPVSAGTNESVAGRVCSPLTAVNDRIVEGVECAVLEISVSPDQQNINISADAKTSMFCIQDKNELQVSFKQAMYMFLESNKFASVCVDKNGNSEDETVQVMISGALQPESSSRLNQLLAFLPNERTKCIDIPLVDDDTALEDIQTLTFTLSVPPESDVALGDIQVVTVLILDDDELVLNFLKLSNLTEGDTGEICVKFGSTFIKHFKISISTAIPANITIDNLATPDIDYDALPLSITVDEDASSHGRLCFTFDVFDDTIIEPVECFPISFSVPDESFGMIQVEGNTTLVCCILDNDIKIGFDSISYNVSENIGQIQIGVLVQEGRPVGSYEVVLTVVDGKALVGEDYTVEDTGVLHFDNTTTRINILVTIVDDDVFEPKEDFIIQLSTSDNNIHFEQSSATITILNDDPNVEMPYTISFEKSDYEVIESSGEVQLCLVILEELPVVSSFSAQITAVENSPVDALAGYDFLATTETATFEEMTRKPCVSFTIIQDMLFESLEEHFTVKFSIDQSPLNIQMGMLKEALVRIVDDDQKDIYFQLNGRRISYNNHTSININDIGARNEGLMCVTDNVNCCGLPNRAGEWYYPNGTIVSRSTEGLDFFRTRGSQSVILNRRNDAQSPIGQYCCKVPDASQTTQIICINITSA